MTPNEMFADAIRQAIGEEEIDEPSFTTPTKEAQEMELAYIREQIATCQGKKFSRWDVVKPIHRTGILTTSSEKLVIIYWLGMEELHPQIWSGHLEIWKESALQKVCANPDCLIAFLHPKVGLTFTLAERGMLSKVDGEGEGEV